MMLEGPLDKIKSLFYKKFNRKIKDELKTEKHHYEMKLTNQYNRILLFEVLKNIPKLIDTMERYSSISWIKEGPGENIIDIIHFHNIQKELLYIKHRLIHILKYTEDHGSLEEVDASFKNVMEQLLSQLKGVKKNGQD